MTQGICRTHLSLAGSRKEKVGAAGTISVLVFL